MTDISIIINAHNEKELIIPCLDSVKFAIEALPINIKTEVILVADNIDATTFNLINNYSKLQIKIENVTFGELGSSRNFGVNTARGKYIAFLDGDDIWCQNWLVCAYNLNMEYNRKAIIHPEYNIYFGEVEYITRHIDAESPEFDALSIYAANYWTALSFAEAEIYRQYPFPKNQQNKGIGYEDWAFNRKTLFSGILHKVAKGTYHAIRTKQKSMSKESAALGTIPIPSIIY